MSAKPYGVLVANDHGGTDFYVALAHDEQEAKALMARMGLDPEAVKIQDFTDLLSEQYDGVALLGTDC